MPNGTEKEAEKAPVKPEKAERIPTGIPGLDGMMEGGLERGSVNLVAGEAGTGKSIVSLQYLYNGATQYNQNGLYITFEEKKSAVFRHMKRFGWDLQELEKNKKLFIYEYAPSEIDKFINEGGAIEDIIKRNKIERLVIDSITAFATLYENDYKRRTAIIKLLDIIRRWGCTTLLPSEATVSVALGEVRAKFGVEYLSDSLLAIYSVRKGDVREMAMEIIKMRGTDHAKKLAPLRITKEGITLFPDQPFFSKQF